MENKLTVTCCVLSALIAAVVSAPVSQETTSSVPPVTSQAIQLDRRTLGTADMLSHMLEFTTETKFDELLKETTFLKDLPSFNIESDALKGDRPTVPPTSIEDARQCKTLVVLQTLHSFVSECTPWVLAFDSFANMYGPSSIEYSIIGDHVIYSRLMSFRDKITAMLPSNVVLSSQTSSAVPANQDLWNVFKTLASLNAQFKIINQVLAELPKC